MFPSLCREGPLTPQRYMGYVALKIGLVQMHLNQHTSPLPTLPPYLPTCFNVPSSLPFPSLLIPSPTLIFLPISLHLFFILYLHNAVTSNLITELIFCLKKKKDVGMGLLV